MEALKKQRHTTEKGNRVRLIRLYIRRQKVDLRKDFADF